jgi:hypothetical protein
MLNIPKVIKIGGIRYKVIVKENVDAENAVACIDTERQEIQLQKAVRASMECNFIHEIFHAINVSLDEEKVEFLAQAMYQIIVDNPKMFGGDKIHGKK